MEQSSLTSRERAFAWVGVAALHALVLLAVIRGGGVGQEAERAGVPPIEIFDVTEQLPPPEVIEQPREDAPPQEEGAASAPNIRSQATPLVVPKPAVELPKASPVIASTTPLEGNDPTQGAAPVPGPGMGAGGNGTGIGSGGTGSGPGGGGTGEGERPSVIARTTLRGRDYPRAIIRNWPPGAPVFVAVRVQLDGRATDCKVNRSSGDALVDDWTCRLVEERVRFRPARDDQGQPYVDWYGYVQRPVNF